MQRLYKSYFIIIISFVYCEFSYDKIFEAKDKIGSTKDYQNPEWSLDSKYFTVEMHMDSSSVKTFKLYLGDVSNLSVFGPIILDSNNKKSSKFGKSKKIRERNLGWIFDEEYHRFYSTIDKSNKIRDCYYIEDELDDIPLPDFEDQDSSPSLSEIELDFPIREYNISDSTIYFNTFSDPKRIWLLNSYENDSEDQFTYSVLGYKDKNGSIISKFKIPIVSISSSKDDEKILLVSYNENQSEIIKLEKDDNFNKSDGIKIFNIETIKKPIQENMNYLYGILDPFNSERFLLIGRNQSKNFNNDKEIINRKNLARVFVLNDQSNDRVEGEFVMYRNIEDNYLYNNPEIQFHPINSNIYFILDNSSYNKNLAYWDGEKINIAKLNLDNIMNFKFSPDGKYLLVTRFEDDMYLYSVK